MKNSKKFISDLQGFKTLIENGEVPERNFQAARKIMAAMGEDFSVPVMSAKSRAAAGICRWVLGITSYQVVVSKIRRDFPDFDIMSEIREQMGQ